MLHFLLDDSVYNFILVWMEETLLISLCSIPFLEQTSTEKWWSVCLTAYETGKLNIPQLLQF